MKITCIVTILALLSLASKAQTQGINKNYNAQLAKALNADDYGMKKYVLVILKTGSKSDLPKATRDSIFRGHMANINRLADAGKLIVAGPLDKNALSYRGIFIFDVEDIEQAKALVETDPVIKSNLMAAEYLSWYGSAALKETLKIHSTIEKVKP
ncbi:YciI family protein [Pedobacter sp. SAFR-022]|uniref:YciI family protein n=1 Tax=Pedobacter sp. SAFR-022 TaxID=3436861 RepID=UPI003F7CFC82